GNQVSTIEIYNVFGERVYEVSPGPKGSNTNTPLQGLGANGGQTIDLSSQPGGVYFLKLKTGDAIINEKIIIQK
ncbi:MAG: T9SS type A sorting domain-containing protein, partial [Bacteroidetes bacterium]